MDNDSVDIVGGVDSVGHRVGGAAGGVLVVTRSSVSTTLAQSCHRSDTLLLVESTTGFRIKDVVEFLPSLLAQPLDGPFESALVIDISRDDHVLIVDRWSSNPGFYGPRTAVRVVAHVR